MRASTPPLAPSSSSCWPRARSPAIRSVSTSATASPRIASCREIRSCWCSPPRIATGSSHTRGGFPSSAASPTRGSSISAPPRQPRAIFKQKGLDTYLRPSAAFSTLGWFNDPLLSTTLRYDSLDLANTVIHEVTHNTFYASGQAVFNESFATFVGARGAEWFFRSRGDTVNARLAVQDWNDDKTLGRFWTRLWHELDSAYRAHPDARDARLAARDTLYARARRLLVDSVGPKLERVDPRVLHRVQLDNAALLARRIYPTELDVFDRVYEAEGRDLKRAIARVMTLARRREDDPYAELRAWVERFRP